MEVDWLQESSLISSHFFLAASDDDSWKKLIFRGEEGADNPWFTKMGTTTEITRRLRETRLA